MNNEIENFPTSVYPEGQKGAAKRAESPEDRLVLHWEQNIKLDRTKRLAPQALDRTR